MHACHLDAMRTDRWKLQGVFEQKIEMFALPDSEARSSLLSTRGFIIVPDVLEPIKTV